MNYAYPLATPEIDRPLLALAGEPARACAQLQALGYQGVELFVRDPAAFDQAALLRAIADAGLEVAAIGTGPDAVHDGLTFADERTHAAAVDRTRHIIDFAAAAGAQINVGKLRGDLGPVAPTAAAARRDDAFRTVCAHAESLGVEVTLEPQNRAVVDNLNSTAESLAWVRSLALPNLRLMLDTFHQHQEDPCPIAATVAARDLLRHVHFADVGRRPPGSGGIDFPTCLAVLRALAYTGFITVEIAQQPDSLTAARRSRQWLRAVEEALQP
jgi:sugar phosphate isomerase/epimerase